MENKAVSDTGPILHLTEINLTIALTIFSSILIPEAVETELNKNKIPIPKKIKTIRLKPEWKDISKAISNNNNIDLGESEAIALALQEKASYLLTDDLAARNAAKSFNIEVHGSVGIILRAYREKLFNKKAAIEKVNELHRSSSLFITSDLINEIVKAINEFKQN